MSITTLQMNQEFICDPDCTVIRFDSDIHRHGDGADAQCTRTVDVLKSDDVFSAVS